MLQLRPIFINLTEIQYKDVGHISDCLNFFIYLKQTVQFTLLSSVQFTASENFCSITSINLSVADVCSQTGVSLIGKEHPSPLFQVKDGLISENSCPRLTLLFLSKNLFTCRI